jgi:aldehyde dehydrogenase (NAD+)
METDVTEIFHVLNEIKVALKSLDRWASETPVSAPLYLPGTRSWIVYEPRGVCLVISPWNYPFSLAAGPLTSAIAAGNSIVLKPSEMTPAVSSLIRKMCHEIFDPGIVAVCEGGVAVSQALLALPFDHIFFTGSPTVGKIVMKAAAENLTSITLELGGKSPAIVTESSRLNDAAERIAVGKFLNNGQTCIAPDYLFVHNSIAEEFIRKLIEKTKRLYAPNDDLERSADYGRVINESNYTRIENLVADAIDRGAKLEWKGTNNKEARFMHPVILTHVPPGSLVLEEEIFGPVLPVIVYHTIEEVVATINSKPKPLALYIFTNSNAEYKDILKRTSSGSVCINECGVQFLHHELPFGGVNTSGIGKAHGYSGFLAFSNEKPVLKQKNGLTAVKAFYPPFTPATQKVMDWFLKLF